ncbi:uncharacterized protein LOC128733717 [Sabethes cyaneus]|uniref:uncharacterized protein LOC128733717 n=1 Tax=Sabethes cyaneus TaxID=53552 RepID=UPI00237D5CFF|nr:uncharacterized protein LOC128733717 [Sabethes cyaneus]
MSTDAHEIMHIEEVEPEIPGNGNADNALTIVQTSASNQVELSSAMEHEEGEIKDEDEDRNALQYENISSEEELSIRERIAQLEAMDSELGRLTVRHHARFRSSMVVDDDAKENYECVSDNDFEMYLNRHEPVPKSRLLPPRRRATSKVLRPSRHKASVRQTVSASGSARRRSEKSSRRKQQWVRDHHSQTSFRKVSTTSTVIHRRHKRRKSYVGNVSTIVNISNSSSDSSDTDFPLDRARLQAACNINSNRKRKTDKENWDALKQKLKLSMQRRRKEHEVECMQDEPVVLDDDYGNVEEEDVEVLQLRLQALKTKAELKEPNVISPLEEPMSPSKIAEEQELRLLALQSTFTKKHQIRLKKRQEERPYSPSDDIPLLLSPTGEFPTPPEPEITNIDDDVQIIEYRPETVEITDSSSSEKEDDPMEISPTESLQCPEVPENQSKDQVDQSTNMENANNSEQPRSPVVVVVDEDQVMPMEDSTVPEAPPPPIIGNWSRQTPDEEDEELLRNQLLSNLKSNPAISESRAMTPDSMTEEEAEALRAVLLSKRNNKANVKNQEKTQTPPQASEMSNQFSSVACLMAPKPTTPAPEIVSPSVATSVSDVANASLPSTNPVMSSTARSLKNPNLITLIGKQKLARKRRKKSENRAAKKACVANPPPLAVASKPPVRTLIKAPAVQLASLPLLAVAPPVTTTTKLVNNPNKLININTTFISANHTSKERSAPQAFVTNPVRKIIIQLGHSDSDSNSDYYPPADDITPEEPQEVNRLRESFLRDLDNASPSRVMLESPTYSPVPAAPAGGFEDDEDVERLTRSEPNAAPVVQPDSSETASNPVPFEQRLDHFLKTVRSKVSDQKQATAGSDSRSEPVRAPSRSTNAVVVAPPAVGSSSRAAGSVEKPAAKKAVSAPAPVTPLAVRHLPKSSQLEYKRLVERMAQLEKQKQLRLNAIRGAPRMPTLTKTIINTGAMETGAEKNHDLVVTVNRDGRDVQDVSNPVPIPAKNQSSTKQDSDTLFKRVLINNTVIAESRSNSQPIVKPQNPPVEETKDQSTSVTSTSSPVKENTDSTVPVVRNAPASPKRKVGSAQTDQDITTLREALRRMSTIKEENKQKVLTIAEYRSEKHNQRFNKELQDLIATVENAQHERQKQYDLENKVAFLKEKLMVLESALALHKGRIELIFPALQQSHSKVMSSRKKSIELNKLCLEIGRSVKGPDYESPSTVHNEIHEQLKILTTETKKLKNMKRLSLDEFKQITAEQRQTLQAVQRRQPVETNAPQEPAVTSTPTVSENLPIKSHETPDKDQKDATSPVKNEEPKRFTSDAPASRSTSPTVRRPVAIREAPPLAAALESQTRLGKYTSPLASFKDQSALNIPDGVICPYQMRGECVDQDCKFEHFQ